MKITPNEKIMRSLCFLFLAFLCLFNCLQAEEVQPQFLSLKGYLNKENLSGARTALDKLSQSSQPLPPFIIEIDSTGGGFRAGARARKINL